MRNLSLFAAVPRAGLLIASIACAFGCGGDKKIDCEQLATHVAQVSTATLGPELKDQMFERIHNLEEDTCRNGKYSAKQADCLLHMATTDDGLRCVGLKPLGEPPTEARALEQPARAKAVAALTRIARIAADKSGVATMHGCLEAPGRLQDLFGSLERERRELHVLLRDETVRTELAAQVRDRKDAALADALGRLEASATGCKKGAEVIQAEIARWLSPQPG